MNKKRLTEAMHSRSPLARREVVTPVNMYQQPAVNEEQNDAGNLSTSPHVDTPTSPQENKSTSGQAKRYTTYLRPETIKAIKREAFITERNVYDVVQTALDAYFAAKEGEKRDQ